MHCAVGGTMMEKMSKIERIQKYMFDEHVVRTAISEGLLLRIPAAQYRHVRHAGASKTLLHRVSLHILNMNNN